MLRHMQKQEDPRHSGQQRESRQEWRQQGEEEHGYGTGALGYTREEVYPDVVQRQLVIEDNPIGDAGEFINEIKEWYKADSLAELIGADPEYEAKIMEAIGQLTFFSDFPEEEDGSYMSICSYMADSMYAERDEENGYLFLFPDLDNFIDELKFYFLLRQCWDSNTDIAYNDRQSQLAGTYGRYPTIYSYGRAEHTNKPLNEQGPHTLAHISTDYLMDHVPDGYDFMQQIPDPYTVRNILDNLGVLSDDSKKAYKYLDDYEKKYEKLEEFIAVENRIGTSPNAIMRELMEMHPMAVYGWQTNLKEGTSAKTSGDNLKGKYERYGSIISVDNNWRRGAGSSEVYVHEMQQYLTMRLKMVLMDPEEIDDAVNKLMTHGKCNVAEYGSFTGNNL